MLTNESGVLLFAVLDGLDQGGLVPRVALVRGVHPDLLVLQQGLKEAIKQLKSLMHCEID